MSSASFPSLELHCRPSRVLRVAVLVLALLAAVSVMLSGLPAPVLLLVPMLALLAWRGTATHPGMVLRFGGDGSLRVVQRDGGQCTGELRDVAERGPLLVLAIRCVPAEGTFAAGGRRALPARLHPCFGPDTASAAQRRLLRLWSERNARAASAPLAVGVR